jgi:glycerate dehydrogenase
LWRIQWKLALVLMISVPLIVTFVALRRSRMMKVSRAVKQRTAGINAEIESSISGIRVAKAFGMRVLAYSRSESESGRAIADAYVDLDTLLAESDVISLHCPLFPETEGIINRETIAKMKDGVILINNSRGGLLNEQDVTDALNCGKIRAAAVDVVTTEPIVASNPLLTAKNCIITPHMSWAAVEARGRIVEITAGNIRAFLSGSPRNVVNP